MISVRRPAAALQTAATRLRLMKYKFTTCHYSHTPRELFVFSRIQAATNNFKLSINT